MSGSIGSLSIEVLSNWAAAADGFEKTHASAKKNLDAIVGDLDRTEERFKSTFGRIASLVGATISIEGLRQVALHAIDSAEKVENLSQALGMSTQSIQVMSYAAQISGGSIDTATNAIARMEKAGEQALAGNLQQVEAFRALGVGSTELRGLLQQPDELIVRMSKHMVEMADGSVKTAAVMQIFGKNTNETIPFLQKLGEGYEDLRKRAEALGVVLSGPQQAAMVVAADGLDELKQAALGAGNQFTLAMLPAIVAVDQKLVDLASSGDIHEFFANLETDISQFVEVAGQVNDTVSLWAQTFESITQSSQAAAEGMTHDFVGYVLNSLNEWERLKGAGKEFFAEIVDEGSIAWVMAGAQIEEWVVKAKNAFGTVLGGMATLMQGMGNFQGAAALEAYAAEWKEAKGDVDKFKATLEGLRVEHDKTIASIRAGVAQAQADNQQWADGIRLTAGAMRVLTSGMDEFVSGLKAQDVSGNARKLAEAVDEIHAAGAQLIADGADATKVHKDEESAINALTRAVQRANAARGSYNADVAGTAGAEDKARKSIEAMQAVIGDLAGKMGGPYAKAWADYQATLDKIQQRFDAMIKAHVSYAVAAKLSAEATGLLNEEFAHSMDASAALDIVLQQANSDLNERARVSGLSAEQQRIEAEYTRLLTEADKALLSIMGPLTEADQKRLESLRGVAAGMVEVDKATEHSKQIFEDYRAIYQSGMEDLATITAKALTGQEHSFKDAWDDIVDAAKQFVQRMLMEYAKLQFINPALNAMFGSVLGYMPTYASAAGGIGSGGTVSGGTAGGTAGGGTDLFGTAQGGVSLFNAGRTMWNGFTSGFGFTSSATSATSMFGTYTGAQGGIAYAPWAGGSEMGLVPNYAAGAPGSVGVAPGSYGYQPSALGYGVAIAGGVYAGYNRWQGSNKDVGGAMGAAAYGVGTYGAAIGAGAAMTGGMAAGLAAVPVVGWIALALMAVDMMSGGKLFGTKGKVVGGGTSMTVGEDGVDLANWYTTKGQSAFFGGAYWKEHDMASTPEQIAAAEQFFQALTRGTENFAKQFGTTMGDLVGGTFEQRFDKKGNITGSTTTIAGHTYEGESGEDFQQRLINENELAVLGQFDAKLGETVDQYRASIQDLTDITNGLVGAQLMFQDGAKFLGLGADQTLSGLVHLAEGAAQFGETVGQAMMRIEQAQQQYTAFIAGFTKKNYVDDYEAQLAQINAQMQANIKQANALAIAAGAEGAATQDLVAIHRYAADQFAQALTALKASAQSLAFSMGLTNVAGLDQVNAEISRLQSLGPSTADSMRQAGNSIQEFAQRATDAMSRLLGNLSPLNDQDKLQAALQGLRAGTVSKEQVLEIGRRLYASSQAYVDLFRMVQGMPDRAGVDGGGGSSGGTQRGRTAAEDQRLRELLEQQASLMAAQDFQNAQTLATQIAEISASEGIDFREVVDNMSLNLADLEHRLGMNDDQFAQYIADQQKKLDDDKQNSTILADILNTGFDDVVQAITGQPREHSTHTLPGADPAMAPRGHGAHGRPSGLTAEDLVRLGQAVGDAIVRAGRGGLPRGFIGDRARVG